MASWLNLLMVGALLIFFFLQMRGYTVLGVSDGYFREALLASASSLGFSIEETMSRIKLKETGQEIQVSIQGAIGTAHLKSIGKESAETTGQIASEMAKYFKNTPGKMNYMICCLYIIIGVSLAAISIWMFTLKFKQMPLQIPG